MSRRPDRHEESAAAAVSQILGITTQHLDDGTVEGTSDWRLHASGPEADGILEVTRCTDRVRQQALAAMSRHGSEVPAARLQRFWELRLPGELDGWQVAKKPFKDVVEAVRRIGVQVLEDMEHRGKFDFGPPDMDPDGDARLMADIGIATGNAYSESTPGGQVIIQPPGMSASISAEGVVAAALAEISPNEAKLRRGLPDGERTGERHLFVWIEPASEGPWMWIGFHRDDLPTQPPKLPVGVVDRLWIGVLTAPEATVWTSDGQQPWTHHRVRY